MSVAECSANLSSFSPAYRTRCVHWDAQAQLLGLPPRRLPFHELRWNQYFFRPQGTLRRNSLNAKLRRQRPDSACALVDRRQWYRNLIGVVNIARSNHANVVWQMEVDS